MTSQLPWQIFVFREKRGLRKKFNVNGQIPKQTGLQASVWPAPSLFLSQLYNGLCVQDHGLTCIMGTGGHTVLLLTVLALSDSTVYKYELQVM